MTRNDWPTVGSPNVAGFVLKQQIRGLPPGWNQHLQILTYYSEEFMSEPSSDSSMTPSSETEQWGSSC